MKLHLFLLIFVLAACQTKQRHAESKPDTPKALEDKSYEFKISRRGDGNLIDKLYEEQVSKDSVLKQLEEKFEALSTSKGDSIYLFKHYDGKITSYIHSGYRCVEMMKDSVLKDKMKSLIASHLEQYKVNTAKHKELLNAIEAKETTIGDLQLVLKIVKTLPLIEKYEQDNLPDTKPLKGYVEQQDKAIRQADKLINN